MIPSWACTTSMVILGLSLVCTILRLLKGPSLPDRILAMDLLFIIAIGMVAVMVLQGYPAVLLDVAFVLALIVFVGTVALARYLERGITR